MNVPVSLAAMRGDNPHGSGQRRSRGCRAGGLVQGFDFFGE